MKTKKTAKIISSVLALVMLVCSLSAVSGFVTSAENEANTEAKLVNALKTSWTKMYKKDFFATFNSESNRSNLKVKDEVNENPYVDADKLAVTGEDVLGFNMIDGGGYFTLLVYKNSSNNEYTSLGNAIKNYDNVNFSIYTGDVTQKGKITLSLRAPYDTSTKKEPVIDSYELSLTAAESKQWINIDFLEMFNCADMEELLNKGTLNRMILSVTGGLKAEGMILGMFTGKTFAKLPSGSMTTLELYNEAKNINADDYINSDDFIAARNALETYLEPELLKDELTNAWSSMYSETEVAVLKTDKVISYFGQGGEPSTMGLTFNGNTVDKLASEYNDLHTGVIFKVSTGFFDSNYSKFADVFNNHDALSVTLKLGTVKSAGKVYLLRTYESYNSYKSTVIDITPEDSGKTITLDTKTLFGMGLSELLTKQKTDGSEDALKLIKIGFSKDLSFEGGEISNLNAVKYAEAPNESDNELLAGKALRIDTNAFKNTAEFIEKKNSFYASLMTGKTLGDVNGLDNINICDLVALNDLMLENYDKDTTYSITGDMNTDGYITGDDTSLLRAELLK